MVEWSCTKERINERGPYILIKWFYAHKRNKSMRTLTFGRMVVHIASAKIPEREESISPSSFYGNCPTISQILSVLSIPSGWVLTGNEDVQSEQDFILLLLCLVWIKRIRRQRECKIPLCNPSGENLLMQSHI